MKKRPAKTESDTTGHSIGQRPIHATYEPPGPLPQFRPRPKFNPPEPSSEPKRLLHVSGAAEQTRKAAAEIEAAEKKS